MDITISGVGYVLESDMRYLGDKNTPLLEIKVVSETSSTDRETKYKGSIYYKLEIIGAFAEAICKYVQPKSGQLVFYSGNLMVPYAYKNAEGEPRVILSVNNIKDFKLIGGTKEENASESQAAPSAKTAGTSKAATAKVKNKPTEVTEDIDFF